MYTRVRLAFLTALLCAGAAAAETPQFASPCFAIPWNPATCPVLGIFHLTAAGKTLVTLPAKAAPNWGTTVANIPTLFAYNMLLNFQTNANLNAMVTGMDQMMLARLSTELKAHDVYGYTPSILADAARKLTGANLRRLEAVFGPALMASAMEYAPAATLAAYNALAAPAPYPLGEAWWVAGKGAGATDAPGQMYLYDVFLDSYTAGAGGSTNPAMKDMERYMNARVKNVLVDVIVAAAAIFAILDSPTAQQVGTELSDWFYLSQVLPIVSSQAAPVVVNWPPVITPPAPDPTTPTLPPIADNPGDSWNVDCADSEPCPY